MAEIEKAVQYVVKLDGEEYEFITSALREVRHDDTIYMDLYNRFIGSK